VLDAQGGIVAVNQAGAAGSAAGQALGKVGERYHPAPGGAGPSGVTVTPLADSGAIVTHRPAPPATG
jgi:hypothetical protein